MPTAKKCGHTLFFPTQPHLKNFDSSFPLLTSTSNTHSSTRRKRERVYVRARSRIETREVRSGLDKMSAPPLINTRRRTRGRSERARVLWFGVVLAVSRLSFVPCFQPKPPWAYACGASSTNSTNSTSSTSRRTRGYTTQTKKQVCCCYRWLGSGSRLFLNSGLCVGGVFRLLLLLRRRRLPFQARPACFCQSIYNARGLRRQHLFGGLK